MQQPWFSWWWNNDYLQWQLGRLVWLWPLEKECVKFHRLISVIIERLECVGKVTGGILYSLCTQCLNWWLMSCQGPMALLELQLFWWLQPLIVIWFCSHKWCWWARGLQHGKHKKYSALTIACLSLPLQTLFDQCRVGPRYFWPGRFVEATTGYTFTPCGIFFASPGIDTRWKGPMASFSASSERLWRSGVKEIANVAKQWKFPR